MKKEYSIQTLLYELDSLIKQLVENEGFDLSSGWQQVDGRGEPTNRAYGQLDAYLALWFTITGNTYS